MIHWKLFVGDTEAQPIHYNNIIYITGHKNLLAINLQGIILWEYKTEEEILCKPNIENNYIYFGDLNGLIYKLDISEPEDKLKYRLVWCLKLGDPLFSSPTIYKNNLYIGSDDNNLYKINIIGEQKENQRLVWKYKTDNEIYTNAVLYNDFIYFSSSDTFLYCLDINSNLKWKYSINGDLITEPLVFKNNIYIGTSDGNVILLNLNGEVIKIVTINYCIVHKPYSINNRIYIVSFLGIIYCFDLTLTELWNFNCDKNLIDSNIYNDSIYILDENGCIYILNSIDGTLIKSNTLLHTILLSRPIIINNNILIKDYKGYIYFISF